MGTDRFWAFLYPEHIRTHTHTPGRCSRLSLTRAGLPASPSAPAAPHLSAAVPRPPLRSKWPRSRPRRLPPVAKEPPLPWEAGGRMRAVVEVPGCSGRRCCRHICPESSELVAAEPPRPHRLPSAPYAPRRRSACRTWTIGRTSSIRLSWPSRPSATMVSAGWEGRARPRGEGGSGHKMAAGRGRGGRGGGGGRRQNGDGERPEGCGAGDGGPRTSGRLRPGRGPLRGAVAAEAGNKMAAAKGESRGGRGAAPASGVRQRDPASCGRRRAAHLWCGAVPPSGPVELGAVGPRLVRRRQRPAPALGRRCRRGPRERDGASLSLPSLSVGARRGTALTLQRCPALPKGRAHARVTCWKSLQTVLHCRFVFFFFFFFPPCSPYEQLHELRARSLHSRGKKGRWEGAGSPGWCFLPPKCLPCECSLQGAFLAYSRKGL